MIVAPAFEIDCAANCGATLRVLDDNADKRHRCPQCSVFFVPSELEVRRREHRVLAFLCPALAVIGLVPLGWPTGLYLVVAAALLWALELAKGSFEVRRWNDTKSLATTLASTVAKGLRDTAAGIAVGLMLVSVVQWMLQAFVGTSSNDAVLRLEKGIATMRSGLGWLLDFRRLLPVALALLAASIVWPMARTLARYKSLRTWTSRGLIVLTTLSAFTFFTSTAVDAVERRWVAGRRTALQQDAARIRAGRQTLIKSAYVKRVLDQLPHSTKSEIRELFSAASKAPDGSSIVHDFANRLAVRMPSFVTEPAPQPASGDPTESTDARRATNRAVANVEAWTAETESRPQRAAASFEDAQRVVAEAARVDGAVQTAQMVVENAIRTIISAQLPTTIDPLISQFVGSLLSSSIQTFAAGAVANSVSTFADAASWVGTHLQSPAERWSWSVGTIDDYRPKPSPDVAQTAPRARPRLYSDLLRGGVLGGERPGSIEDLRRGLASGWVVTQNAAGKIFVHEEQRGDRLVGLQYLIKEGLGGQWTVYTAISDGFGGTRFGRLVGTIEKPTNVTVTGCVCR